ncbi:hypothetical protein N7540_002739 [Penicillium herquei]|nr:hypothetical protein N7540_002739 [Penicillium herquei]
MRPIILLSIPISICSALAIPDQEAILDTFWKNSPDTEKSSYKKLLANEPESKNQAQLDTESLWGTFASQVEPVRGSAIYPAPSLLEYDGLSKSMKVFSNKEYSKDGLMAQDEGSFPGPGPRPHPGYPGQRPPHPGPGYPHHGPCDNPALCPGNSTIWELISQSHRTTRLADMIRNNDDLVKLLSNESANYTLFAPTNRALDRLMSHFDLPSIASILRYHVIHGRVSWEDLRAYKHQTLATTLSASTLGQGKGSSLDTQKKKKKRKDDDDDDKEKEKYMDHLQRLRVDAIRDSVLLNGGSEIIAGNIIASNGIIHHIDIPLTPPSNTSTLLRLLPEHFSTFTLALSKSNLEPHFDATSRHGGTTFAPTNSAFRALGPRINGFLFSPQGEECLRALLQYHIVPDRTIYSDAIYWNKETAEEFVRSSGHHGRKPGRGHHHQNPEGRKGRYPVVHVDSSTLLESYDISMDIMRQEWNTEVRINGFWEPRVVDLLAGDGVIHVVDQILIPPKTVDSRVKGRTTHEEQLGILSEGLENCGRIRNPRIEL